GDVVVGGQEAGAAGGARGDDVARVAGSGGRRAAGLAEEARPGEGRVGLAVGLVAVGGEAGRAEAQSVTVGLGAVGGGDRQRQRIDGQFAADVGDVVVGGQEAGAAGGARGDDVARVAGSGGRRAAGLAEEA